MVSVSIVAAAVAVSSRRRALKKSSGGSSSIAVARGAEMPGCVSDREGGRGGGVRWEGYMIVRMGMGMCDCDDGGDER